jgi:hypothetical protein
MSFKKLTVADQNADNFLKIQTADSPCCGDSASTCEYTTTYTAANTVSAVTVTIDGVSTVLTFPAAVSGATNVRDAIIAALATVGVEAWSDGLESVSITGTTTFTVVIFSDVPFVSLTASGGTATFTGKCTPITLCTQTNTSISASAAGNSLSINGKNTALIDIVYGTTAGSAIKTSVDAAITASGVANLTSAISATGTTGPYIITFTAPAGTTIYFNKAGVYELLDPTNCTLDWV